MFTMRNLMVLMLLGSLAFLGQAGCEAENSSGSGDSDSDSDSDTDTDTGTGNPDDLVSLSVTPTNDIFEVDLNTDSTFDYKATATFGDGHTEDYSSLVTWEVDLPSFASFNGATLEIPAISTAGATVLKVSAVLSDDFVGKAQLTVVAYQMTGTQKDFFFLLPYNDASGEQEEPLEFSTAVQDVDVFFDMDTTGSMSGFITNLQSSLTGTVIPDIQSTLSTAWFGVGSFEDFPISPYGSSGDQPFTLSLEVTDVVSDVTNAVNGYSLGSGGDGAESITESLFQIATGFGLTGPSPTNVPANTSGVGGVGFRDYSLPAVIPMTDIYSHNGINTSYNYTDASVTAVTAGRADAIIALNSICARVVGVADSDGDADMIAYAEDTGAVVPPVAWGDATSRPINCGVGLCCTGISGAGRSTNADGLCPLAFLVNSSGTGLGTSIVTGIEMLTHYAAFDCETETTGGTADVDGVPLSGGHTTADFIKNIVPVSYVVPTDPPGLPNPTMTADGFDDVTPGTVVTFDVTAYNDFVEETPDAQWFEATISVLAGGCFPLDDRLVMILVPPTDIVVD